MAQDGTHGDSEAIGLGPLLRGDLLVTVKRLAAEVGEPPGAIYRLLYTGKMRGYRRGTRGWRVTLDDYRAAHEVVEPGDYEPDPERQQAAVQRAARGA